MDCSIASCKPRRLRKNSKHCHTADHVQRQAPETSARPIARGALGDRRWIGALEGEGFRDEVKRRSDPHGRMAGEADQQPNADLRLGPCDDEGSDERQFERGVRWYPEAPAGNTATSGLDKFGAAWPGWIDDAKLVKAAAETDECDGFRIAGFRWLSASLPLLG
jgi:hypothetical protein